MLTGVLDVLRADAQVTAALKVLAEPATGAAVEVGLPRGLRAPCSPSRPVIDPPSSP